MVTVSSNAQAIGRIDFEDLQGARSYSGARAYNQSKLANVLFSYELAFWRVSRSDEVDLRRVLALVGRVCTFVRTGSA